MERESKIRSTCGSRPGNDQGGTYREQGGSEKFITVSSTVGRYIG